MRRAVLAVVLLAAVLAPASARRAIPDTTGAIHVWSDRSRRGGSLGDA